MTNIVEEAKAKAAKLIAAAEREVTIVEQLPTTSLAHSYVIQQSDGSAWITYKGTTFAQVREIIDAYGPLDAAHMVQNRTHNYAEALRAGEVLDDDKEYSTAEGFIGLKASGFISEHQGQSNSFAIVAFKTLTDGTKARITIDYSQQYFDKSEKHADMFGYIRAANERSRHTAYTKHLGAAFNNCMRSKRSQGGTDSSYKACGVIESQEKFEAMLSAWEAKDA